MSQLFILLFFWLLGLFLLFFWIKNQNHALQFHDVVASYTLSAIVGFVFAFAGSKANISHWLTWIIFTGLSAFLTYKFLEKKNLPLPASNIQAFASATKYPAGSMGAADQKSARIFVLVAVVIYVLVILCFTSFHFDTHEYFKRAGTFVNIVGIAMAIGSFLMVAASQSQVLKATEGFWYWVITVAILAFGLCLSCGFNFSDFGIVQH